VFDWRWNFDNPKEADAIKSKFYDTTGVLNEWNDFNFWNNVGQSMDNIEIQFDGILNDIENQIDDNNDWMNWNYWENWGSNQAILKALEETADCEAGTTVNFWEDSENNNDIVIALLQDIDTGNLADTEDEADKKESDWDCMLFWDGTDKNEEILKELVDLSEPCTKPATEDETDKKGADWDCMLFWDDTGKNEEILKELVEFPEPCTKPATEDETDKKGADWDCMLFWDDTGKNEEILKELVEFPEPCNKTVTEDPLGFWDDIEENKSILEGLLDVKSQNNKEDHWENWDFWNEFGQVDDILNAYEEVLRANKTKSPMSLSNLCKKKVSEYSAEDIFNDWNGNLKERQVVRRFNRKKKQQQDIDKIFWQISLENDGSQGEHRRLSEEIQNLPVWESPDVFNDYSELFDSTVKYYKPNQRPKDPVNIFKSWRNIFDEPIVVNNKKNKPSEDSNAYLLDDMEDVYGDWASVTLSDGRSEKKRQARGMKKDKNPQGINQTVVRKKSAKNGEVRRKHTRPGTPTITTVAIKPSCMEIFEYKYGHDQTYMNTKKEKKTVHVWKNARSQKRLQAKLFAKQPRSRM
jgi:hypothetical protein